MLGSIDGRMVGLAALGGGHFLRPAPRLGEPLVDALGEERFRGLYALLALAALTWTVLAYGQAPAVAVWAPPAWTRWIPNLAMPVAAVLLVAGITTRSPHAASGNAVLYDPRPVRRIHTLTRQPFRTAPALRVWEHPDANGT